MHIVCSPPAQMFLQRKNRRVPNTLPSFTAETILDPLSGSTIKDYSLPAVGENSLQGQHTATYTNRL